jgi:hypothetical protein
MDRNKLSSVVRAMDRNKLLFWITILLLMLSGAVIFAPPCPSQLPIQYVMVANNSVRYIEERPISYDLAFLDSAISEINIFNPNNGTNCLPRAIALNRLLTDYGVNSTIQIGANLNLSVAHAWVVVNGLEIFGRESDFPIPYGAGYYEVIDLTGGD